MEGRRKREGGRGEGRPSSDRLPSSWGQAGAGVGAVIVAAGSGSRMGGMDKLFVDLGGQPLLARTLGAFRDCPVVKRLVLVLAPENRDRGRELLEGCAPGRDWQVCDGGPRRQDSVRLGLTALSGLGPCEWVAVHDGARPLLTPELILRALEAARQTGAAVPAVALVDTVKEAGADGLVLRTLDRSRLWAVQTPQVFRYDLLLRAHSEVTADPAGFTDDAAMLEALGLPVRLFPGERANLKVTTPEDLRLAAAMLGGETRNSQVETPLGREFRASRSGQVRRGTCA